jgi:uncharacterized protein GlcG (DUF336 family)
MRVLDSRWGRSRHKARTLFHTPLEVELLERRVMPDANSMLQGSTLAIFGGPNNDSISVTREVATDQLVVTDAGREVFRVASSAVTLITVNSGDGNDVVFIGPTVTQNAQIVGGNPAPTRFTPGGDVFIYDGSGSAQLYGGPGDNRLIAGGASHDNIISGGGNDNHFGDPPPRLNPADPLLGLPASPNVVLTANDVNIILQRATAATATNDGIMAVVDRSGRILGVMVEAGVDPAITSNTFLKVFAIDGAVAEARTAAFLANDQAPLTSRTFQTTSQTTVTQREIESYPSITDPNSTLRGPGFVAPLTLGDHFPPGVAFTPQVDQFAIEHTNRDTNFAVNADNIQGSQNGFAPGDDVALPARFNEDPNFIPANIKTPGLTIDPFGRAISQAPPISYGAASGLQPFATPRGLGTLPGGIPIYKNGTVVGAIGTFFPGKTGFADEENSSLDTNYDPSKPDRSLEAEYIGFAAAGGSRAGGFPLAGPIGNAPALPPGFDLPAGRIDLVGITLDVFGPKGNNGPSIIAQNAAKIGVGTVNGTLQPLIDPGPNNEIDTPITLPGDVNDDGPSIPQTLNGTVVPEGFLVLPHDASDGSGLTANDVFLMIFQGVQEALITRAAIRLPLDSNAVFVLTVTSKSGEVLGQFRMPDSTIFSIDVATSKARNASYYADPAALQANPFSRQFDEVPGVPPGAAFTARTFRFLALPRFPEGIDGNPPGFFSQLLDDPGIDRTTTIIRNQTTPGELAVDVTGTGLQVGPRQPASAFQHVLGFDAFNPGTNFHDFRTNGVTNPILPGVGFDPAFFNNNLLNRDGIVFFPGSTPVYKTINGIPVLVGGFGDSGDGVDQDDIINAAGVDGNARLNVDPSGDPAAIAAASATPFFGVPSYLRADAFSVPFLGGLVRLPFQKFNRQPNINPVGSANLGNNVLTEL